MTTNKTESPSASEQPKNLFQRISAVMAAVSYVQKGSKQVNGQYNFVSHDQVTAKIRPALVQHGVVMITDVVSHRQDGNRTEAEVELHFVNIDNPTDRMTVKAFGYGIDPQDKGPGKAISYAVKYGLLKTFCLETGDDPDKDLIDYQPPRPANAPPEEFTPNAAEKKFAQWIKTQITAGGGEENCDFDAIFEAAGAYSDSSIRDQWRGDMLARIQERKAKQRKAGGVR